MIILDCAALSLAAASPSTKAVSIERNSADLEFSYGWSAEAAAIPRLDQRFRADMAKAWSEANAIAREEKKLARQQKRTFNPQFYSMTWTTAGQSKRLLSLQSDRGDYTGGAHPNRYHGALLWDRALGRPIEAAALFRKPGALVAVTHAAYCKALDAERAKRREGFKPDLPDFNACPKYSDLAIAAVDTDKDGRFDHLAFVASPYIAGPYVEGEYEVSVRVTAPFLAALKPEYRSSFEAQRQ